MAGDAGRVDVPNQVRPLIRSAYAVSPVRARADVHLDDRHRHAVLDDPFIVYLPATDQCVDHAAVIPKKPLPPAERKIVSNGGSEPIRNAVDGAGIFTFRVVGILRSVGRVDLRTRAPDVVPICRPGIGGQRSQAACHALLGLHVQGVVVRVARG